MRASRNLAITGLPPGCTETFVGRVVEAARAADVRGQGLAQLRDAGVGAVGGLAVADRRERRLDDVLGRRQVEVAEVERIDRLALGGQRRGLGGDGEDRLGAELRDALRDGDVGWWARRGSCLGVRGELLLPRRRACGSSARPRGRPTARTSFTYSVSAAVETPARSAYFFTNLGVKAWKVPSTSLTMSSWPSTSSPAPMPSTGIGSSSRMKPATSGGTASTSSSWTPAS